jgi:putative ABC transport system permease protein
VRIAEAARVAWEALRANKLRSGLTILGVVIGVASVVVLVAIGTGARNEVTSGVESLGSNILFVAPGTLSLGATPPH